MSLFKKVGSLIGYLQDYIISWESGERSLVILPYIIQWMSVNVSECQWMSVNVSECQWMPVNVSECQWMSVNVSECQWMSVNVS